MTTLNVAARLAVEGDSANAYERYLAAAFSPWAAQLVELARRRNTATACSTPRAAPASWLATRRHAPARPVGSSVWTSMRDMLRVAHIGGRAVCPPIQWRHGDVATLPFADGTDSTSRAASKRCSSSPIP